MSSLKGVYSVENVTRKVRGKKNLFWKGGDVMQEVPTARWTVTQPWRGLFGILISVGIAIGITVAFDLDSYLGLFTLWAISVVPIEVVMGLGWGGKYPPVDKLDQPWRGIALTAFMFFIASISTWWVVKFVGGGTANVVTNVYIICVVLTTMFHVIAFGCWPFGKMSLPAKGFLTLIVDYLIMLAGFRLWDFSGFAGANPELAGICPTGPVYWESALAFYFIMFVFLWVFVALDMWPFTKSEKLTAQPLMGFLIFVICFVLAYISYIIGVSSMGIKPIKLMLDFLLFIAGILTVVPMLQTWPGRRFAQPAKGFVNMIVALVFAFAFFYFYQMIGTIHFGPEAMATYPANCMIIANLCLALMFPAYVMHSTFLDFWPLPPTPES